TTAQAPDFISRPTCASHSERRRLLPMTTKDDFQDLVTINDALNEAEAILARHQRLTGRSARPEPDRSRVPQIMPTAAYGSGARATEGWEFDRRYRDLPAEERAYRSPQSDELAMQGWRAVATNDHAQIRAADEGFRRLYPALAAQQRADLLEGAA